MPTSFASLPAHERQAFFSLLDEYFQSRPHLLPGGAGAAAEEQEAEYAPQQQYNPTPAARSQPPAPAARKPATSSMHAAPTPPAGLSSGKSVGRIDMANKGSAFGSMIMGKPRPEAPASVGEAISGVLPKAMPATTSRTAPPPAPAPRVKAEPASLGQAEVLYDYNGTEAEDLSVKRYDIIDLVEKISEDWWKGRSSDGREGIVPSTYVKQI
ncbi:uncharacterized protein FA14DRAFT_52101 [Meira miltonrushii]|uniref:SH3 domain-containing protein n=1 Tax=Meira miltonrushii TaxID=1280837 RepID=A0A316VII2_9BASI|nr:uncharacterized protein FA14DRAFT_52101 [Meira miltonrushii]PWN36133.1 hypothetical protein FA14DRAFT_52101 [Meira miltonrushii]